MLVPKKIVLSLVALFLGIVWSESSYGQDVRVGVYRVVIDPGHGGTDPGAVSARKFNLNEKDITLDVALRLGKMIKKHYPEVEVFYTRSTDASIGLRERSQYANKVQGDLFISIHINAAKATSAHGTETLVMGVAKEEDNLETAIRENSVITYEDDYKTKYESYTKGSTEHMIMYSMMQDMHQEQSYAMAAMIQNHFTKNTGLTNRGIKQRGVYVLFNTAMPRVLAEFGFISNDAEAQYISSEEGKAIYASSLFDAFSEYKTHVEGSGTAIITQTGAAQSAAAAAAAAQSNVGGNAASSGNATATVGNTAAAAGNVATVNTAAARNATAAAANTTQKAVYRVQVMSSATKVARNSAQFGVYRGEVKEYIIGGRYKYYVKESTSHKEALLLQAEVRKNVDGAFVVAFLDNTPITVEQAKKINKE